VKPKYMEYKICVIGGTFSKFHIGHLYFLRRALSLAKEVIIGLSTQVLLDTERKRHPVEEYESRFRELYVTLVKLNALNRVRILPLNDPYGPLLKENKLDVLLVSKDTVRRGEKIIRERAKRGLREVRLIVTETVLAEDGKPISSERIWRGIIDRNGKVRRTLYLKEVLDDLISHLIKNTY